MLPRENTCIVYHGTNLFSAKVINYNGIMLNAQRELTDFGKGFYVTFNRKQAIEWARIKAHNPQVYPAMLETLNMSKHQYLNHPDTRIPAYLRYDLDLNRLSSLHGMIFPMPHELGWPYYKNTWETLVRNCRMGVKHNYDFVYGPIGGRHPNGTYQAKSPEVKEQLSFHSKLATYCLSNLRIGTLKPEDTYLKKTTMEHLYGYRRNPLKTIEFDNQFLREIRDCVKYIGKLSYQQANRRVENSWVATRISKHEVTFIHEPAAYWAFSILYRDYSLWYKNYEMYMLRQNPTI